MKSWLQPSEQPGTWQLSDCLFLVFSGFSFSVEDVGQDASLAGVLGCGGEGDGSPLGVPDER